MVGRKGQAGLTPEKRPDSHCSGSGRSRQGAPPVVGKEAGQEAGSTPHLSTLDIKLPEQVSVVPTETLLHVLWQGGAPRPPEGHSQVGGVV